MQMVKESLNDGYCDISGLLGDLTRLGELNTLCQSLRLPTIVSKVRWGVSHCSVPRVWLVESIGRVTV